MINKPNLLGPEASRAGLAHMAAQQFFPETATRDDIGDHAVDATMVEGSGQWGADRAKQHANHAWGSVKATLPDWNDRSLSSHQRGELKADSPDYQHHRIEGLVEGDPRSKSDVGRRNRVWHTNAEMN